MKVRDYRDLRVWQLGIEIVDMTYLLTQQFPRCEIYGLASQMQRAAVSIPSNIAEGFSRRSAREYRQFLYVARGSCAELMTQSVIAQRRKYSEAVTLNKMSDQINHEERMLMRLILSLGSVE